MTEKQENRAEFVGTITEKIILDTPYEIIQSEKALLRKVTLQVQRPNGQLDNLILFADPEELRRHRIGKGLKVSVEGVMHTYNEEGPTEQERHVRVYVKARKIRRVHTQTQDKNVVIMEGTLTKTPHLRQFARGRNRANFILCTKDLQDEIVSFVPCVAKDQTADVICELPTGEELSFIGKLQSRDYIKVLETGIKQQRTAFEVMVNKLI